MNLTPEERTTGKENFEAAIEGTPGAGGKFDRRTFLGTTLAVTVAGAGVGSMYFGYAKEGPPKNPLRVGFLGTGDEGEVLLGALHSPETRQFIDVVAIADIRPYNIHRAFHGDHSDESSLGRRPGLMAINGWKTQEEAEKHVKVYKNGYKELLDDPNVEAVVIALPLHLHSVAAIQAMRKGKHVITEKLMGHTVHECKEMGRVAKEEKKILAVGHQRNYSILYDNAKWLIANNLLGEVHSIRAQWHRGNLPGHDSWQQPLPSNEKDAGKLQKHVKELTALTEKLMKIKDADAATSKDLESALKLKEQIEMQLTDAAVDAAKYGYQPLTLGEGDHKYERSPLEELIRWRLWNRTGAGLMAELGSHQLDAAGILIGAATSENGEFHHALPLTVTAVGERSLFPLDRECEDHVYCIFEFPGQGYYSDLKKRIVKNPLKKIVVTYSSINGNGFGDYGEVVMGTEGTLVLEKELEAMLFKSTSTSTKLKVGLDKAGSAVLNTAESGGHAAPVGKAALELGPISRGYTEELEHWAWCIKNPAPENMPRCTPSVALGDAVIALVSNQVIREGKSPFMEFKPEWYDLDDDATPEGVKPDTKRDDYKI